MQTPIVAGFIAATRVKWREEHWFVILFVIAIGFSMPALFYVSALDPVNC